MPVGLPKIKDSYTYICTLKVKIQLFILTTKLITRNSETNRSVWKGRVIAAASSANTFFSERNLLCEERRCKGLCHPQTQKNHLGHLVNMQIPRPCPRPTELKSSGRSWGCSYLKFGDTARRASIQRMTSLFKRWGRAGSWGKRPFLHWSAIREITPAIMEKRKQKEKGWQCIEKE